MNDMSTTSERSSAATKVITRMRVPGGRELHLPLAPGEAVTQEVESWPLELTDQEKAAWVAKATVVALRRCTLVLIETAEGETAAGTICAHAKAKFDREIGVARARDRALRRLMSMREKHQRDVEAPRAARTAERLGEQR